MASRRHFSRVGSAERCTETIFTDLSLSPNDRKKNAARLVHVGAGNAVDMMQARLVAHAPGLDLHEHDTFHHNVPMFLEREGLLVPLLKRELLALLQG